MKLFATMKVKFWVVENFLLTRLSVLKKLSRITSLTYRFLYPPHFRYFYKSSTRSRKTQASKIWFKSVVKATFPKTCKKLLRKTQNKSQTFSVKMVESQTSISFCASLSKKKCNKSLFTWTASTFPSFQQFMSFLFLKIRRIKLLCLN